MPATKKICGVFLLFILAVFTQALYGVMYPFEIFTTNGSYYDNPDLNFYVEVTEEFVNQVSFTIHNDSPIDMDATIASIYFDDGSLLGISTVVSGPGTSFDISATPGNLPSGNTLDPSFVTTNGFLSGADNPKPHNGVNPQEWVQINFDLQGGSTFLDVIDQLNIGDIRIGMHIINLPDDSSESTVNIPEPATVFVLGMSGLIAICRKAGRLKRHLK